MKPASVICKFCQKLATFAPLEEMSRRNISIFYCHHCSAEYTFWSDGSPSSEAVYTYINLKLYRWVITPDNNAGYLWYIKEPGMPGLLPNKGASLIKEFKEDVPAITPTNIEEKLKTYLVFI